MPYDVIGFEALEVPTALPFDFDTTTPDQRLLELARLLENEQEWRDTIMEWDFDAVVRPSDLCGTAGCAIGLAHIIWPEQMRFSAGDRQFNLTQDEWANLFSVRVANILGIPIKDVTPGMVATRIREFVTNRQASQP